MPNPDPVEYPRITIGEIEYEVKFSCADIIELKRQEGFDVFERNPGARRLQRRVVESQGALRQIQSAEEPDQEALVHARDVLDDAQDALDNDTQGWQHPLDRMDVEMRFKLLSYGLRHAGTFAPLDLARQIPFERFVPVFNAVTQSLLKASAQTTAGKPAAA